jgi:hypothetical protein
MKTEQNTSPRTRTPKPQNHPTNNTTGKNDRPERKPEVPSIFDFPPVAAFFSGVDWLTCTQAKTPNCDLLLQRGRAIVKEENRYGNDLTHWKGFGYHGWRSGGASVGERGDTFICTLSSETADSHWRSIAHLCTNASRIDLQSTYLLTQQHLGFFDSLHKHLESLQNQRGRKATLSRVQDNKGSNTIYIGSKHSDLLIRIYDKGIEQLSHPRETLIRIEIQLRNGIAWKYLIQLRELPDPNSTIAASIPQHLTRFKIAIPFLLDSSLEVARVEKTSDNQKRLAYLQKCVRPLVEKLIVDGHADDILTALFGSDDALHDALRRSIPERSFFKNASE